MKIEQIIKKLNNTELGKTGIHETYVQIPTELDVSGIFDQAERAIPFVDKTTRLDYGSRDNIRLTIAREHRICGLGQYYRDKDLSAGDEILFEKRTSGDNAEYFLDVRKLTNTLVLKKDNNKGYEVLTPKRLCLFQKGEVLEKETKKPILINFYQSIRKRADSKELTNYYKILLDGVVFQNTFANNTLIEIEVINGIATIRKSPTWKRIEFTQEVEL